MSEVLSAQPRASLECPTPETAWPWTAHSRDALGLGRVGHSRKPLGLGTPGDYGAGHSRDTLGLGTPGRLWGWALKGHSGPGRLWGWALKGHSGVGDSLQGHSRVGHQEHLDSGVGHSRETLGLGSRKTLGCTPEKLSNKLTPGTLEENLGVGTPGRLWGWALQGHSRVGH